MAPSRAIVVARTLLDHIPPELEAYHSAVLCKRIRGMCSKELMRGELAGQRFQAMTLPPS
jgi:hypothetical protein